MIKIYGTKFCSDCSYVYEQIDGNADFQIIDIFENISNLKEFIMLRDTNSIFDSIRRTGRIGLPCFLFETGKVTLSPEDTGLKSRPIEQKNHPLSMAELLKRQKIRIFM